MERTEQQKRIEAALFHLINESDNRVYVCFISANDLRGLASKNAVTRAERLGRVVRITLVEPLSLTTTAELNAWGDAIVEAEAIYSQIEEEAAHEKNNPNFFLAMKAKYENEVHYSARENGSSQYQHQ